MDTHTTDRKPPKARAVRRDCCGDEQCLSGSRNNYFPGKRLTPDSFRIEQKYLVERRQLLNRAIHGWGLVYGFPVAMAAPDTRCPGAELGTLEVGEGLALDRTGRELVQVGAVALTLENIILLDDKGAPVRTQGNDRKARMAAVGADASACWLLKAHYAEHSIGPVTFKDSCSCERTEWDQVCETVRYSLQRIDCSACCVDQGCELACGCATGACCEQPDPATDKLQIVYDRQTEVFQKQLRDLQARGASAEEIAKLRQEYDNEVQALVKLGWKPREQEHGHGRGGCRCLCDHLTGLQVGVECRSLCEVDNCARADLHNGVALACVKLGQDECGNWRFASVYDACGPRRLVKRNDLLFDLIRGCDVTRISEISWKRWHRQKLPIAFQTFAAAFGRGNTDGGERVTNLGVRFSGPVRAETLGPDCFAIRVRSIGPDGWRQTFEVPITDVTTIEEADGLARGATIGVNPDWIADGLLGRHTIFQAGQTSIEIEVRGDFIVDCNGQTVDANAFGLSPGPSGNGTPGGTFLSTFVVDVRPPDPKPNVQTQPAEGVKT
jgi:hypothetical protein